MQTLLEEKVNVDAVFRGFKDKGKHNRKGWEHKRIEPRYIQRQKGEVLKIEEIRQSYAQRKCDGLHVHFVVHCQGDRYFHLVYDTGKIVWILLYEFDDQMNFDDTDIEINIDKGK